MSTSDSAAACAVDDAPVMAHMKPGSETEQWSLSGGLQPIHSVTTVKVVEAPTGPHAKTSPCWRVFQEFAPAVNGKNVSCMVKTLRGGKSVSCGHMLKWSSSNGTSGMVKHLRDVHPEDWANVKVKTIKTNKAGKKEVQAVVSQGPIDSFVSRAMPSHERKRADRLYTIWAAINLRPQNMIHDYGFKLFVGIFSSSYITETVHNSTFNSNLRCLYDEAKANVMAGIEHHITSCEDVGWTGPFLAGQIGLTTSANHEYITFTVTYVPPGADEVRHVGLATREFPGTHTVHDISEWMKKVTRDFFSEMMGEDVQPAEVFLGITVSHGGNVFNAIDSLRIPVLTCAAHRLNTAVMWALGIAGSAATCKNKAVEKLMERLAALVGVFSHSAVNNDQLQLLQELEEELGTVLELVRRNDTRWTSQRNMMDRLLRVKKCIQEYFKKHHTNPRKLTNAEWLVTNEVCSLLDPVAKVTTRIQGGGDAFLSQSIVLMATLRKMLNEDTQEVRVTEAFADGAQAVEPTEVDDLSPEAQQTRRVLIDAMRKKELGFVSNAAERVALLLDPRYKKCDEETCTNGGPVFKIECMSEVNTYIHACLAESFGDPTINSPDLLSRSQGAGRAGVTPTSPAAKKIKLGQLHERRAAHLKATARSEEPLEENKRGGGAAGVQHKDRLREELVTYLAEKVQPEDEDFCLLRFWARRSTPTVATNTKEVVVPAKSPHLGVVARLYHSLRATSCQAEIDFSSSLSLLITELRTRMTATKVEQMMFLRLNKESIPEVSALTAATRREKMLTVEQKQNVKEVQTAVAGSVMDTLS